MAQLTGPAGPFRGFALTHTGSRFQPASDSRAPSTSGPGSRAFADAELERRLGAANPGVDAATLKRRFGVDLERLLKVQVTARLPGAGARRGGHVWAALPVRLDAVVGVVGRACPRVDRRRRPRPGAGVTTLSWGVRRAPPGRRRRPS